MPKVNHRLRRKVNRWFLPVRKIACDHQPMVYNHDGQRLEALMNRAKVPNSRLAEASGKSDQAVGKWIRTGKIARESIPAICRALHCSSDELLGILPISDLPNASAPSWITSSHAHSRLATALTHSGPRLSPAAAQAIETLVRELTSTEPALDDPTDDAFARRAERAHPSPSAG